MFIAILPSARRLRSGTIRLKMPVETNSVSSCGSKSLGESPSAEASFFLSSFAGLKAASLRHGHAMRASVLKADFHRQNSRARFLENVYAAFLGRNDAKLREQEPRSDDRMPRKLQLFFRG